MVSIVVDSGRLSIRLKTESENWDALVEMRKQKADEAER